MADPIKVYLIVHELFGIIVDEKQIELVTPVVGPDRAAQKNKQEHDHEHKHEYRIGRFKEGKWQSEIPMQRDQTYRLRGIVPRRRIATNVPCHPEFSPHPPGTPQLNDEIKPFCRWKLSLPKQIHQLRLVSISECDRPVFTGDPHGDAVEVQLCAVSLAQAFEYDLASQADFGIFNDAGKVEGLDYTPDTKTTPQTINLHLWAQLENELGMSEKDADKHASRSTAELVRLFKDLVMEGTKSLSVNDCHSTQVRMPPGIRFPELMTLAEKFVLLSGRGEHNIECTGKTCGHGGNLFVSA